MDESRQPFSHAACAKPHAKGNKVEEVEGPLGLARQVLRRRVSAPSQR